MPPQLVAPHSTVASCTGADQNVEGLEVAVHQGRLEGVQVDHAACPAGRHSQGACSQVSSMTGTNDHGES